MQKNLAHPGLLVVKWQGDVQCNVQCVQKMASILSFSAVGNFVLYSVIIIVLSPAAEINHKWERKIMVSLEVTGIAKLW